MRCRQCGFENMPGLDTCGRCQSALAAPQGVDVWPPRARGPKWVRTAAYLRNRWLPAGTLTRWAKRTVLSAPEPDGRAGNTLAGVASVVPGLGHLATHRLHRLALAWPAWCACLLLGLWIYGTSVGGWLIGVAMALHAWIICDAGGMRQRIERAALRIAVTAAVFAALCLCLYAPARRLTGQFVRGARVGAAMEDEGIRRGDFLLVWMRAYAAGTPRRGDVVLYRMGQVLGPGYVIRGGEVIGRLIGMPGDHVEVGSGSIRVSRDGNEMGAFPVQGWLARLSVELDVPEGCFFCLPPETRMETHGRASPSPEDLLPFVALASDWDILGRAFMVWNPMWRRRFIHRSPIGQDS